MSGAFYFRNIRCHHPLAAVRIQRKYLLLIYFLLSLAHPHALKGQNYSTGYKRYVTGDFAGAEHAFQLALSRSESLTEKARLHKMIGITRYMQGKRVAAEASFKQAKKLNPYLSISSSEVLDDNVINFFRGVQAELPKAPATPPDPPAATRPSPPLPPKKKSPPTTLTVFVNVYGARLLIDGHIPIVPSQAIMVSPGTHEITAFARGYDSASQSVAIRKGIANHLSINLRKHPPKVVPRQKKIQTGKSPARQTRPIKKNAVDNQTREEKVKKVKKKGKGNRSRYTLGKSTKKRKKRKLKSMAAEHSNIFGYFMPFGTGQYLNNDTGLGIAFSVLQGSSLIFGIVQFLHSEKLLVETNNEIERMDSERAQIADAAQQEESRQRALEYQNSQQDKLDRMHVQQMIGLSVFGLSWAVSAIEAFMSSSAKKSRKSISDFQAGPGITIAESEHQKNSRRITGSHLHAYELSLRPAASHSLLIYGQHLRKRKPKASLSLHLNLTF